MPDKPPALSKKLAELEKTQVRFVLIGGLAMRAHGSAYITDDIDFAYSGTLEDRRALLSVFCPDASRVAEEDVPHLRLNTEIGPVDIHAPFPGDAPFNDLWGRSIMELYDVPTHVAALEDIIAMKKAAGRLQDRNHLLELKALHKLVQEASEANG